MIDPIIIIFSMDGVGKFEVTPQRVGKIRRMAKDIIGRAFRSKREVSPRSVRQFCGLVQSCYLAIPVAQLFQRSLRPGARCGVFCVWSDREGGG